MPLSFWKNCGFAGEASAHPVEIIIAPCQGPETKSKGAESRTPLVHTSTNVLLAQGALPCSTLRHWDRNQVRAQGSHSVCLLALGPPPLSPCALDFRINPQLVTRHGNTFGDTCTLPHRGTNLVRIQLPLSPSIFAISVGSFKAICLRLPKNLFKKLRFFGFCGLSHNYRKGRKRGNCRNEGEHCRKSG